MELDLPVVSAHQVVDNVRGVAVAAGTAEPLVADQTLDHAGWRVDSAVSVGSIC